MYAAVCAEYGERDAGEESLESGIRVEEFRYIQGMEKERKLGAAQLNKPPISASISCILLLTSENLRLFSSDMHPTTFASISDGRSFRETLFSL